MRGRKFKLFTDTFSSWLREYSFQRSAPAKPAATNPEQGDNTKDDHTKDEDTKGDNKNNGDTKDDNKNNGDNSNCDPVILITVIVVVCAIVLILSLYFFCLPKI